MTRSLLLFFCIIIMTSVPLCARAEGDELPRGRVVEKVSVAGDPSQHYALYLPSTYAHGRKYPVLYCFDPGARGALPVSRFKEAAEKYGYIVVGSNNSRNGPGVDVNDIFRKLWDDTHARFHIDDGRVYLAGFSGGARLALAAGYALKGAIAGVIACSGGFPSQQRSSQPLSFALFGTAGVADFNNPEMRELFRSLDNSAAPRRLAFFGGGHEWPPSELVMEAIEWMELQAMRAGLRQKDQSFIENILKRTEAGAREAERAGELYRAYSEYSRLADDFRGLLDVKQFELAASRLKSAEAVLRAIRRERSLEDAQRRRMQELSAQLNLLLQAEERTTAMSALRREVGEINKALSKPDGDEAILAKRLFDVLLIRSYEQGSAALFRKDYLGAAASFALGAELQPKNPRVFYQLARAYALAKEKGKALEALRAAADRGFDDMNALSIAEFQALREDKRFKEAAEAVAKNRAAKAGS